MMLIISSLKRLTIRMFLLLKRITKCAVWYLRYDIKPEEFNWLLGEEIN